MSSKSSDSSQLALDLGGAATLTVRELRDDELQEVSGGYNFTDVMVESFVAAETKTTTTCTRMANSDFC